LAGISKCFSPGSNGQWDFERDLLEHHGIPSSIMDRAENLPADLDSRIHTFDCWLGFDEKPGFKTLNSWVAEEGDKVSQDLMLQMDIEGYEYDILMTTPQVLLERFRILVIEFHYTQKFTNSELFKEFYSKIFERLGRNFTVVHFHPNNCCGTWSYRGFTLPNVFEVTLLRNDRIEEIRGVGTLPHPLDRDCVPDNNSIIMNFLDYT